MKNKKSKNSKENISRKAAIKKLGFGAFTAGTMMFLLSNPAKAQDPSIVPEWEW
jgi:hypothetical protein